MRILKLTLRSLCVATLLAPLMSSFAQSNTPGWPTKPIKVLVGVPPGGSTDAMTRMFADWLQESLGQPTVVENRPGANTVLAADAVAKSAPDGHTLLVATEAIVGMPLLTKTPFEPFKDFAPVGILGVTHFVMVAHPAAPFNTPRELVAYAQQRPGTINYGSSGNAGSSHFGLEKFKLVTATDLTHIPYRGAGPALTDGIAGQYQLSLWTPLAVAQHVKSGKLKALAATGSKRVPVLPQVPTFAEAGIPAYDHKTWWGVFAPAGTPKVIVDRLNTEISKMLASAKARQRLDDAGVEPSTTTPDEFAALLRADSAELAKLIATANIKMD